MLKIKFRLLSFIGLFALILALWGGATYAEAEEPQTPSKGLVTPAKESPTPAKVENPLEGVPTPEEKFGIKVLSLRLSANGNLLDFRYRVLNPDKAVELLKRSNKPYLIDQASGAKFLVPNTPKIGPLRQSALKPKADRNYFVLFANPGKFITPGRKVTVVIGDFRIEDLVVQ